MFSVILRMTITLDGSAGMSADVIVAIVLLPKLSLQKRWVPGLYKTWADVDVAIGV
jgi:hypothetical protein